MLAEAISKLASLGQAAAEVKAVELVTGDPRRKRFITNRGDQFDLDISPSPRNHVVRTLQSLRAARELWCDESLCVVFHDADQVVLLLDHSTRWDRVTLPLPRHALFLRICDLGAAMDHRSFSRLLRQDLDGAVDPRFVQQIRAVSASYGGSATSEVGVGREKGMRQFDAGLSDELPDVILLRVPVYDVADAMFPEDLRLGFEVTLPPAPLAFSLRLLPGEKESAIANVQAQIAAWLGNHLGDVTVLAGTP